MVQNTKKNYEQITRNMRQKNLCASDKIFRFNDCNGHVKSNKRISDDEFRCTNGNRCRNLQINIDNAPEVYVHETQMKCNRSQCCLSQNNQVQTSFRNVTIYSKFAFHRIIHFIIIILLFAGCCVVNGQQRDSYVNVQNTGESFGFSLHSSFYSDQFT